MRVQSMGRFQVVGRVGSVDVIKGGKGIRISVAVNELIKENEKDTVRTNWLSVTVWGEARIESLIRNIKKGYVIAAEGDLASSEYTTKGGDRLTIIGLVVGPSGSITTIFKSTEIDERSTEKQAERDTRSIRR